MAGTLAFQGVVSALKQAVCGPRPAQRAAVASSAAAAGRRGGAALLRPLPLAARTGGAGAGVRGAAAVCCSAAAGAGDVVEVELKVDGMVCDGCSSRVAEALQKLPGVKQVHVDLEKGIATVQVEAANQLDAFNAMPQMVDTVTGLGFEAQPHFASE